MSDSITWNNYPPELLTHLFSYVDIPTLGKIAQINHHWKANAEENNLWHALAIKRYGESGAASLNYFVHAHQFSWKEAYRGGASLLAFCLRVLEQACGSPRDCIAANPLHSQLFPEQSLPNPFVAHAGYHFSIIHSIDIVMVDIQTQKSELLNGSDKDLLTHLQADGNYLFSLSNQGMISQWDITSKKRVATFRLPRSTKNSNPYALKDCFLVRDKTIYIQPNGISQLDILPYEKPLELSTSIPLPTPGYSMIKEGQNLYIECAQTIFLYNSTTRTVVTVNEKIQDRTTLTLHTNNIHIKTIDKEHITCSESEKTYKIFDSTTKMIDAHVLKQLIADSYVSDK